jgi:hypothetical protein
VLHLEDGRVRLQVRSAAGLCLSLILTEPAVDEECSITLERMAEYRLEFVPEGVPVVKDRPLLTKATLECGHCFSAMALLYHLAQNSMTCPCCRAGHAGVKVAEPSLPVHVRRYFLRQLDRMRLEERQEQIEADSMTAAHMLESEVTQGVDGRGFELFLRVNRVVLILYAYENADSLAPLSVQELPLSSSPTQETQLLFTSCGFYQRQMAANLRNLPVGAFEAVVATRNLFDGLIELHRSTRFQPKDMGEGGVVGALNGAEMRVEMLAGTRAGEIGKFVWSIPKATFGSLLVWSMGGERGPSVIEI